MVFSGAQKSARYRAKDVDAYRKRKNALAKTPEHRIVRATYAKKWRDARKQSRKPRQRRHTDQQIADRRSIYSLRYRTLHRESLRKKSAKYYKKYRKDPAYKAKVRDYHLRKKYGISSVEFDAIFVSQNSKCKICFYLVPKSSRGWHLDHNHETGEVRGILCHVCNTKLGWYEQYRQQIEEYLK